MMLFLIFFDFQVAVKSDRALELLINSNGVHFLAPLLSNKNMQFVYEVCGSTVFSLEYICICQKKKKKKKRCRYCFVCGFWLSSEKQGTKCTDKTQCMTYVAFVASPECR